jgi:methanethiol S-methyltransferase
MNTYLILSSFWLLFYITHSILAADAIKLKLAAKFPFLHRYYRLLYNLISLILFAIAFLYQRNIQPQVLFELNPYLSYSCMALMLFAMALMALTFKQYSKNEFIGISQLQSGSFNPAIGSTLNIQGLNKYVRHPLYTATFIFLLAYLGYKPYAASLVFVVISSLYLILGTYLEEQKLLKQFGEAYKQYQSNVPMFFPFI